MILWIKWLHLIAIVTMIVPVLSKDLLIFIHPQTSPHVFKKMKQVGMVALSLIFITGLTLWGPYLQQGWLHAKLLLVFAMIGVEAWLGKNQKYILFHFVLYAGLAASVFFLAMLRPF